MSLRDLDLGGGKILPKESLDVKFARSGGPGGQNVNKVETKVDLRVSLAALEEIVGPERTAHVRAVLENRIDADDRLQIVSQETRSRSGNIVSACARMETILRDVLKPKKKRRPTRPTRGSVHRRLDAKKQKGERKRNRTTRWD